MAEILAEGRYVRLVRQDGWEWTERVRASGVAVIVALTDAGELVLVEQHRVPMGGRVVELPAGLAGDGSRDEPVAAAAARELEEETGFRPGQLEQVAAGPVSAGLTSELLTFFRARDLVRVGPGGGDDTEDIEVHLVPLAEVRAWLAARAEAGVFVDPKIYAGLFFLAEG